MCGCCQGVQRLTPMVVANRPGLSALAYRVGTHPSFLESMKAKIESEGGEVKEPDALFQSGLDRKLSDWKYDEKQVKKRLEREEKAKKERKEAHEQKMADEKFYLPQSQAQKLYSRLIRNQQQRKMQSANI